MLAPGGRIVGFAGIAESGGLVGAITGAGRAVSGNSGVVIGGKDGCERQPKATARPPNASIRADHFRAMTCPRRGDGLSLFR